MTDEIDDLIAKAEKIRSGLMEERQRLLSRLEELDNQLMRLPGAADHPLPVSLAEFRDRRRRLSETIGRPGQPVNTRDIQFVVATFYGFTVSQITGRGRFVTLARARNVAMYLARKMTSGSYPEIARAFGERDHTTVISNTRRIEEALVRDAELRAEVEQLEAALRRRIEPELSPSINELQEKKP